ncbi:MAG: amidohydrolase family protein, partial [Rhodococcus qingshengii]
MDLTTELARAVGVDAHAHYFGTDLAASHSAFPDSRWPRLVTNGSAGRLMLGDTLFRTVRS